MQPSDLHKTPDRLDHGIEDLYWENGKLFATHPMENSNRHKWTSPLPGYSLSDMAMQSTEKDHSMKLMNDEEEEKIEKATAFATGDDLIDYLDNLDSREPVGMPTSKPITSLPSSQSYLLSSEINRVDPSSQHLPTLSGDLADFATLCGPASLGGHLSVSARGRPVPSLPFSIPQDEIGKLSDAVLNRISAQCMGSSSLQPLETTLLNQNAGDSMILNVHRVAPIGNLLSSSNVSSLSSIDISPSSDLDSVLLDSSGSGFSAGNGGKSNEGAGVKKARAVDDLDSDSEGFFDEIVAPRKPRQEQGPSTKRMRAAEIHNEAERKRRGKINEKLKALQELIPNANKTDKASVLTEAIDYLKKLRLQLQLMCCRNGLVISPVVVSQGAQNPQMQQAGADLNIDREIEATQRASGGLVDLQQFPLTSMAAREFSVQTGVPPFNEASFAATEALVSSSKGLGHEFNTNSTQQVSFSQPYQGITQ